jgi:hypothetical protein
MTLLLSDVRQDPHIFAGSSKSYTEGYRISSSVSLCGCLRCILDGMERCIGEKIFNKEKLTDQEFNCLKFCKEMRHYDLRFPHANAYEISVKQLIIALRRARQFGVLPPITPDQEKEMFDACASKYHFKINWESIDESDEADNDEKTMGEYCEFLSNACIQRRQVIADRKRQEQIDIAEAEQKKIWIQIHKKAQEEREEIAKSLAIEKKIHAQIPPKYANWERFFVALVFRQPIQGCCAWCGTTFSIEKDFRPIFFLCLKHTRMFAKDTNGTPLSIVASLCESITPKVANYLLKIYKSNITDEEKQTMHRQIIYFVDNSPSDVLAVETVEVFNILLMHWIHTFNSLMFRLSHFYILLL